MEAVLSFDAVVSRLKCLAILFFQNSLDYIDISKGMLPRCSYCLIAYAKLSKLAPGPKPFIEPKI